MGPCFTADQIEWYVAGTLPPDEAVDAERHQADCANCRAAVASFRAEQALAGDIHEAFTNTVPSAATTAPPTPIGEQPGDTIGRYKLLQQIGEGGFGVVFVAEQREPVRRKVALKIIKPGMDTREVLARFEAERQALAMMDHPNVAKVYDAGATATGRPYFVMEHVAGLPINEYCDSAKLRIRDRLELFVGVCKAVQHAHHKGIIHRDLKPSNILVTVHDNKPVPKVIDFGVAKAIIGRLTDRTLYTETGRLVGTPEYMAPEQAGTDALDVDTRADIYSLGVILYELLTGTLPFDRKKLRSAGFEGMARIIRELEPPRPSTRLSTLESEPVNQTPGCAPDEIAKRHGVDFRTLQRQIRGELDWITLKALEKDRARRYETANGLSADIGRYLGGAPVLAAPPSATYRMKKFVQRHRAGVIAGTALAAALILGIVGTGFGFVHARRAEAEQSRAREEAVRERERAEGEAQRARLAEADQSRAREEAVRERERAESEAQRARSAEAEQSRAREEAETASAAEAEQRKLAESEKTRSDAQAAEAKRQRDAAEMQAYVANIAAASAAIEGNNVAAARERLERAPEQLRNWEWRYLNARVDGSLATYQLGGEVWSVAFSADGKRLAAKSRDGALSVWDTASGEQICGLWGCDARRPRAPAVLSPDGTRIAFRCRKGDEQSIKVVDTVSGSELWVLPIPKDDFRAALDIVAFSNDGTRLAGTAGGNRIILLDASNGREVMRLPAAGSDLPVSAVFSPDGARLISTTFGGTTILWDLVGGREIRAWQNPKLCSVCGGAGLVAFDPDGASIACQEGEATVTLRETTTGAEIRTFRGYRSELSSLAFSPNGHQLAAGHVDGSVTLWDTGDGTENCTLRGHTKGVFSLAFTREGTQLASGSDDGTVKLWDTLRRRNSPALVGETDILPLGAFSLDGKQLAGLRVENIKRVMGGFGMASAVGRTMPSGMARGAVGVITAAGALANIHVTLVLWDTQTGNEILALPSGILFSLVTSADGALLATGGGDGTISIFHATGGGEPLRLHGARTIAHDIALSPDCARLAAAHDDGTLALWEVQSGAEIRRLRMPERGAGAVAFSADGAKLAAGCWDGSVKVLDAATGNEIQWFSSASSKPHQSNHVTALAFSPDGRGLAAARRDGSGSLWNTRNGGEISLPQRGTSVSSIAYSADGARLAMTQSDGVIVWDAAVGEPLQRFSEHKWGVSSVTFSADGTRLLSVGWDGKLIVRDCLSAVERAALPARNLVDRLLGEVGSPRKVLDRLEADTSLSPEVRAAADSAVLARSSKIGAEARRIVDKLAEEEPLAEDLVARLKADTALSRPVRDAAIRMAELRSEDAKVLEWRSWRVIRAPGATPDAYRRATRWAEAACKLEPKVSSYSFTVGAAQYRLGQFEAAVETHKKADTLAKDEAPPLAVKYLIGAGEKRRPREASFRAMSLHQLGRRDEARKWLRRARSMTQESEFAGDDEVQGILREAETLIEGSPASKPTTSQPTTTQKAA